MGQPRRESPEGGEVGRLPQRIPVLMQGAFDLAQGCHRVPEFHGHSWGPRRGRFERGDALAQDGQALTEESVRWWCLIHRSLLNDNATPGGGLGFWHVPARSHAIIDPTALARPRSREAVRRSAPVGLLLETRYRAERPLYAALRLRCGLRSQDHRHEREFLHEWCYGERRQIHNKGPTGAPQVKQRDGGDKRVG